MGCCCFIGNGLTHTSATTPALTLNLASLVKSIIGYQSSSANTQIVMVISSPFALRSPSPVVGLFSVAALGPCVLMLVGNWGPFPSHSSSGAGRSPCCGGSPGGGSTLRCHPPAGIGVQKTKVGEATHVGFHVLVLTCAHRLLLGFLWQGPWTLCWVMLYLCCVMHAGILPSVAPALHVGPGRLALCLSPLSDLASILMF